MEKLAIYTKWFKLVFIGVVLAEILSFWAYQVQWLNISLFFLIIISVIALGFYKLEWAFWIAAIELIIGSFGQMFYLPTGGYDISVRLGIFVALFIVFALSEIRKRQLVFRHTKIWKYFIIFLSYFAIASLIGLSNGNPLKDVFLDVNGYIYFLLIIVAYSIFNNWEKVNKFLQLMFAAITAMTLKTLFLVFYFSHVTDESLISLVYKWVRDTRVGEIAQIIDNYYRIFFQSHIWAVIAFIIISMYLIYVKKKDVDKKQYYWAYAILCMTTINLIVSFSRSFWAGLGVTLLVVAAFLFFKEKYKFTKLIKIASVFLVVILIDLLLITAIVNVTLPRLGGGDGVSVAALIRDRVTDTDEAAVTSRFELLNPLADKFLSSPVFGSGFGTSVTYDTDDPRSKGLYTTYSFEWGYLDILVKTGLVGFLLYSLFIFKVMKQGIKAINKTVSLQAHAVLLGLIFSLIFIVLTHITTPYINHPLGIFLILVASAVFYSFDKNNEIKPVKS